MNQTIIEFNNFKWHYSNNRKFRLDIQELKIRKGSFVGIIGPTGAGKTTFCYSIMGVVPHLQNGKMEGSVRIEEIETKNSSLNVLSQKVGLVVQNPLSQMSGAGLNVEEEIAFGLENHGYSRQEMIKKVKKIIELIGLKEYARRSPFELSGGQQQKVAIASILVLEPEILVLDEPTGYLDPLSTDMIFTLVKELKKQGKTIIFVSHKFEYLNELCDEIILINKGKIIKKGAPTEIFSDISLLSKNNLGAMDVTNLFARLKKAGKWKKRFAVSVEESEKELRSEFPWMR